MNKTDILSDGDVSEILRLLELSHPDAGCALKFGTPFQLLIAVILSAQTTDEKVNTVTETLFKSCPSAAELAAADLEWLREVLRPIGMFRQKAGNITAASRILLEKYDGQVPDSQAELEKLPGVGRKTANVVMSVAFGHQRIAVDTHVFRVSNRIGLVNEKDVLRTEEALMLRIPEDQWTVNHHRLIWHGRKVCSARKPACGECALNALCMKKIN